MHNQDVPRRANHVLHLILIAFLLILIRTWYLAVIKHDEFEEKTLRPQRRTLIEPACRGTIRDRFNIPLAINKIQYNAAVLYDRIREVPLVSWEMNEKGKKTKVYKRRRYIEALSSLLGKELELDPIDIEDLIYSHASIFPNTPFVLKEDISEKTYYRLRMLEKDWAGLITLREAKRFYPQGKAGSDIVGYVGAINERQYFAIADEMRTLEAYLKDLEEGIPAILPKGFQSAREVKLRYEELKEKAYTIRARVGKMGIERVFDQELRGLYGKRQMEIGAKGHFIRNLPGASESVSGKRVLLTISSELQEYAELLLVQNEKERREYFSLAGKNHESIAPPWILGGAIIAMIPQTGEVAALASYPRFEPNDFIQGNIQAINKWVETSTYIANIWDGKATLSRELHSFGQKKSYEEHAYLSWDHYLDSILSSNGTLRRMLKKITSIGEAVKIIRLSKALMHLGKTSRMHAALDLLYTQAKGHLPSHLKLETAEAKKIDEAWNQEVALLIKKDLDPYFEPIKHNDDKLLLLDLLRLAVDENLFSENLLAAANADSLASYRALSQSLFLVKEEIQKQVRALYHERIFPLWRKEHFKAFLKEKREEEIAKKTYEHPYTDYLAEAENKLFDPFWKEHEWTFLSTYLLETLPENFELKPFLFHLLLCRSDLKHKNLLKERLKNLPSDLAIAYLQSMRSFAQLEESLWGHYYQFPKPYEKQSLQDLASFFYPKNGLGFAKSFAYGNPATIGSLFKLVTGYEALKQNYVTLKERHQMTMPLNPLTIYDEPNPEIVTDEGMALGRTLEGKWIARHYKGGRLPRSHASIGKVDFLGAIERSSNIYFSLLAGDIISHPADLYETTLSLGFGRRTGIDLVGEIGGYVPDDIRDNRTGLYAFAIGQHSLVVTPLQTARMLAAFANGGEVLKPQIVKLTAGSSILKNADELFSSPAYAYLDYLHAAGVYFPLFTETQKLREQPKIVPFGKEVQKTIFLPEEVKRTLFEGLHRVVWGEKGSAHPFRIRTLSQRPKLIHDYKSLKDQFIGKTSTAEFAYRPTLDRENPPLICKDIWFGAVSFKNDNSSGFDPMAEPELIVVVYLRFGDYGKEAAPLAAQVIKKWREISSKN